MVASIQAFISVKNTEIVPQRPKPKNIELYKNPLFVSNGIRRRSKQRLSAAKHISFMQYFLRLNSARKAEEMGKRGNAARGKRQKPAHAGKPLPGSLGLNCGFQIEELPEFFVLQGLG
jgi:hypothetical protein